MVGVTLIWHRHDLRVRDNVLYHGAPGPALSVYVFDPAAFARRPMTASPGWEVTRTGPHQALALLSAVAELRASLRSRGGELLVRHGDPASVLPALVLEHGVAECRWHEEPGSEEAETSARVHSALRGSRCRCVTHWGCTLYHPDDLPAPDEWATLAHPRRNHQPKRKADGVGGSHPLPHRLTAMPRVMGDWRRAVRSHTVPRATCPPIGSLSLPVPADVLEPWPLPTLNELMAPALSGEALFGLPPELIASAVDYALSAPSAPALCTVGEEAAHARLRGFVSGGTAAAAERSAADTGLDDSSKLSTPLALGCLSPRQVYEVAAAAGDGSSWLCSHMEMRDFFCYYAVAAGGALFRRDGWAPPASRKPPSAGGVAGSRKPPSAGSEAGSGGAAGGAVGGAGGTGGAAGGPGGAGVVAWRAPAQANEAWVRWATGRTGLPLVDAAMRELLRSGYTSNRARQNAASFLTKDLRIDWRAGAEWFQWLLADHDVAANFGNWAYFSGVGADPKQRHFRTVSQALKYDRDGAHSRRWLPELAGVAELEAVLRPYAHSVPDWPEPLVDPSTQLSWQDAARLEETGRLLPERACGQEMTGNTPPRA
mgnify:CR=1 FL=1|jgi:deoxyribodipyrimidine photo-lyase